MHRGGPTLRSLNVLDIPMDASLACWALFSLRLYFSTTLRRPWSTALHTPLSLPFPLSSVILKMHFELMKAAIVYKKDGCNNDRRSTYSRNEVAGVTRLGSFKILC